MKKITFLSLIVMCLSSISCNNDNKSNSKTENDTLITFTAKSEDYNLQLDSITISGTLTLPEVQPPYNVVLIIAGSGPTDRNGNSSLGMTTNCYKMLADTLAYYGFASVRYDKRGIAKSYYKGFNEMNLKFDSYINDASEWIKKLKTDTIFSKIIVLGHSEGSLIGMLATELSGADAFISVAGPSESADSLIQIQISNQSEELGNEVRVYLKSLKAGKQVAVSNMDLWSLFRPSIQPYMISWFKYTPKEEISKLTVPILVIHGTTDIQIDYHDAENLAAANNNSTLKIIEGMNHILKIADADTLKNSLTYTNPDLPLSEEFCKEIISFLKKI